MASGAVLFNTGAAVSLLCIALAGESANPTLARFELSPE